MIAMEIAALIFSTKTLSAEYSNQDGNHADQLESIVVTARRVEENPQDIPVAVAVIKEVDIKQLSVSDLADLTGKTPSLSIDFSAPISGASNAASIYIRGVGQTDFLLTNDPAVGVYLDDVYLARSVGAVLSMADVEQVEVLRGPQGTLFGRNTIGGALNVITRQPGNELGGSLSLKLGEDGRRDTSLGLDLPLIDNNLAARVSVSRERRDGYSDRVLVGDTLGNRDREAAFLKVSWHPSESIGILFSGDYISIDENSAAGNTIWLGDPSLFGRGLITDLYNAIAAPVLDLPGFGPNTHFDSRFLGVDPFTNMGTGPNQTDINGYGSSIQVTWNWAGLRLKSISGYREMDANFGRDADSAPITLAETRSRYDQSQASQEFQLSNSGEDSPITWLIGAYYFEEEGTNIEAADIAPAVFQLTSDPSLAFSLLGHTSVRNTNRALFAHASFDVNNRISLGVGSRYTHEKKRAEVQFFAADIDFPLIGEPVASLSYDDFSPRLSGQYRFNQDLQMYVSVSKGFKSGGFTGRYVQPTAQLQPFDAEKLIAWEVGLKGLFFDKRLLANVTGFFSEYDDLQILVFDGLAPQTRNAGEGEIKGVEFETKWLLNDALSLSGFISIIDAQYTALNTAVAIELFESLQLQDDFVNTPEWSYGATISYEETLFQALKLNLILGFNYTSDTANDAINTPELIQEATTLVYGRISVDFDNGLEFSAYGRNLTDETVIVSGAADIPTFGGVEAIYAPPRELGVEVNYAF